MSEYIQCQTNIQSREALIAALHEMGYTNFEEGENLSLYGYRGDRRKETADIVIRRKYVRTGANDLGFKKQADGTYKVIISQFDQSQDKKFVPRVTALSAFHNAVEKAKRKGYKVKRTRINGKLALEVEER